MTLLLAGLATGCRDNAPLPSGLDSGPALELTFLFSDRAGLEEGDPVTLRGFTIGKVHAVHLKSLVEVEVRIISARRDAVLEASYGRLHTNPLQPTELEIVILDPESKPITDTTRVPGAVTKLEVLEIEARYRGIRAGTRAADSAEDWSTDWLRTSEKWLRKGRETVMERGTKARELGKEAAEKGAEVLDEGARAAKEGAEKAWKEAERLKDFFK
ncbi:MAG: hypothetical protein ACI9WU_001525 [Myxococcota bacterium]|jgi:hypothetical protein